MREYDARVDKNQAAIVEELRAAGLTVVDVHSCAPFDLIVISARYEVGHGQVCLVEIKSPGGRLTARETKFLDELKASGRDGVYLIAYDAADVLRWFGR